MIDKEKVFFYICTRCKIKYPSPIASDIIKCGKCGEKLEWDYYLERTEEELKKIYNEVDET